MLLTLILLFKFGNILVNFRILTQDKAWLAWNIIQMVESVILPTVSFVLCDRSKYNIRAILLAVIIFNICSLLQYILLISNPEYFYITTLIFICLIIPYLYRYVVESLHPISDMYYEDDCFLVYKRPSSITGSLCALITAPYGHCSLVVEGQEFTFKHGVVIERKLEVTNKLTFKKIQPIDIREARTLVGTKWSLKNNCFATFSCFQNKGYE